MCWFGHVQRVEENRIVCVGLDMYREWKKIEFPKKVLYMNLEKTRLRGGPRNRWQDKVREDGRLVDGEGRKEREWKKLLRMARNCHILHMPME